MVNKIGLSGFVLIFFSFGLTTKHPKHLTLRELTVLANCTGYSPFNTKAKTLGFVLESKNENKSYTHFTSYVYQNKKNATIGTLTLKDYADTKPLVIYSYHKNLQNLFRREMTTLAFVPEKQKNTEQEESEIYCDFENKKYRLHFSYTVSTHDETMSDSTFIVDIWRK